MIVVFILGTFGTISSIIIDLNIDSLASGVLTSNLGTIMAVTSLNNLSVIIVAVTNRTSYTTSFFMSIHWHYIMAGIKGSDIATSFVSWGLNMGIVTVCHSVHVPSSNFLGHCISSILQDSVSTPTFICRGLDMGLIPTFCV